MHAGSPHGPPACRLGSAPTAVPRAHPPPALPADHAARAAPPGQPVRLPPRRHLRRPHPLLWQGPPGRRQQQALGHLLLLPDPPSWPGGWVGACGSACAGQSAHATLRYSCWPDRRPAVLVRCAVQGQTAIMYAQGIINYYWCAFFIYFFKLGARLPLAVDCAWLRARLLQPVAHPPARLVPAPASAGLPGRPPSSPHFSHPSCPLQPGCCGQEDQP